jgi:ubiquinone/menaquinone biosynthesis C-methylase UbiE
MKFFDTLNKFADQSFLVQETIKRYCKDKTVLDLGCGNLRYSIIAKKAGAKKVIAIDIKKPKRLFEGIKFIQADAQKTPFKNNYFDVIICIGLIEYVDLNRCISEIKRLVKPGGIIIIQTKDSRGFRHKLYQIYCKIKKKKPKGMPQNYLNLQKEIKNNFEVLMKTETKPKHNIFYILKK